LETTALRARPLIRVLLCAYSVFHLTAITLGNVPQNTAMGSTFHRPFRLYLGVFSLYQTWDMFTTIPHFLAMTGELLAEDAAGNPVRRGPLLPGFEGYRNDNRLHVTFMRLAFSPDSYPGFPQRYLASVCRALTNEFGAPPKQVGFELRVMQLRPLSDVRRDHRIGEPKTISFGPTQCVP